MAYTKPNGTLSITSSDALNKKYTENLGTINLEEMYDENTQQSFASEIDTFARAITNLTTNTYQETVITVKFNINEILAE